MDAFSATQSLIGHLCGMGYRASSRAPRDMPGEFITVERVGGPVRDMTDHPSMALQAWAATDAQAEDLANEVRLSLLTSAPPPGIHSIRVESGPYQFYDENTGRARYQMVLAVSCQLTI